MAQRELLNVDRLEEVCSSADAQVGVDPLVDELSQVLGGVELSVNLTRSGWHLTGGIIDRDSKRIARRLIPWIDEKTEEDFDDFVDEYVDEELLVTRHAGRTHYISGRTGTDPMDFVQLDVEELQEQVDRLLFNPKALPECPHDLIEPRRRQPLPHIPIGSPWFRLRRASHMVDVLARAGGAKSALSRFVLDWMKSSAGSKANFETHWALDFGKGAFPSREAIPLHTHAESHEGLLKSLHTDPFPRGGELARIIHDFDREIGYPMAWYFAVLVDPKVPRRLALAVDDDLSGEYSYLPDRDRDVLAAWVHDPYSAVPLDQRRMMPSV